MDKNKPPEEPRRSGTDQPREPEIDIEDPRPGSEIKADEPTTEHPSRSASGEPTREPSSPRPHPSTPAGDEPARDPRTS